MRVATILLTCWQGVVTGSYSKEKQISHCSSIDKFFMKLVSSKASETSGDDLPPASSSRLRLTRPAGPEDISCGASDNGDAPAAGVTAGGVSSSSSSSLVPSSPLPSSSSPKCRRATRCRSLSTRIDQVLVNCQTLLRRMSGLGAVTFFNLGLEDDDEDEADVVEARLTVEPEENVEGGGGG